MAPFMAALMTFGVDRIMFSVDYPFASNARARAFLDALPVSPADRAKIAHGNADRLCREQVKLAGLGDTSCGRSFVLCPPEERCLRRAFPGGTVRTISRSRPGV